MRKLLILKSRVQAIYSRIRTTTTTMTRAATKKTKTYMPKMTGLNAAISMRLLSPNSSVDMLATPTNLAGPLALKSLAMKDSSQAMTTLVMV